MNKKGSQQNWIIPNGDQVLSIFGINTTHAYHFMYAKDGNEDVMLEGIFCLFRSFPVRF